MRQLVPILMIIFFMSCKPYLKYSSYDNTRALMNIPLEQSTETIFMVFPGDTLPTEPYFPCEVLRIYPDTTVSMDSALSILAKKAYSHGLDAVILSSGSYGKWIGSGSLTNGLNHKLPVKYYLEGLGIKFKQNMDYITYVNKSEKVQKWNKKEGRFEEVGFIEYDLEGNTIEIDDSLQFVLYFDQYSMDHLIHEENDHWVRKYNSKNELIRKFHYPDGYHTKRCKIQFNEKGQPSVIQITYHPEVEFETITISYNENDMIKSRYIDTERFGVLFERRNYDELNRVKECIYYDTQKRMVFRREWGYFSEQDVMDYDPGFEMDSLIN